MADFAVGPISASALTAKSLGMGGILKSRWTTGMSAVINPSRSCQAAGSRSAI